jgi:hypothetical protein
MADCFARVTVDALNVRTGTGLDAPQLVLPQVDAPPVDAVVGLTSGREHVFLIEGPIQADGFAWYQVGVMNTQYEQATGPLFVGWVASGDGTDPWLVPEDPCPTGPVELADLTYAGLETTWAIYVGCFGDRVLTLRGWFPLLPPDFQMPYDPDGSCFAGEPAFLLCGPYNWDIRTSEMSFYDPRNTDRLDFTVDPAAGVVLPERGQWIEITGAFDHPAAQHCGPEAIGILNCRAVFVASAVRALTD